MGLREDIKFELHNDNKSKESNEEVILEELKFQINKKRKSGPNSIVIEALKYEDER